MADVRPFPKYDYVRINSVVQSNSCNLLICIDCIYCIQHQRILYWSDS